jgi:SAM-dependent methyltransferase
MESEQPLGIMYVRADAANMPFAAAAFDFATAFTSLMDMPDQASVLAETHRVLRPGGFLQFSILHPCFVPPHRRVLREPDGKTVRAIEVGGYLIISMVVWIAGGSAPLRWRNGRAFRRFRNRAFIVR